MSSFAAVADAVGTRSCAYSTVQYRCYVFGLYEMASENPVTV